MIIYLLESGNYYKIGQTANLPARLKTYETHNPEIELIDYFNAPKNTEKEIHKACKKYLHRGEWFHKNDDILDEFQRQKDKSIYDAPKLEVGKSFVTDEWIAMNVNEVENISYANRLILYYILSIQSTLTPGFFKDEHFIKKVTTGFRISEEDLNEQIAKFVEKGVLKEENKNEFYLIK